MNERGVLGQPQLAWRDLFQEVPVGLGGEAIERRSLLAGVLVTLPELAQQLLRRTYAMQNTSDIGRIPCFAGGSLTVSQSVDRGGGIHKVLISMTSAAYLHEILSILRIEFASHFWGRGYV